MKKIKFIIPFIMLFALLGLLWRELFYSKPNELPSALIGELLPKFHLATLNNPTTIFTSKDLSGQVSLINVWATWCYACGIEHPMLMKISKEYHIPIYGIDYKDNTADAQKWLQKNGNPYIVVGLDTTGDVAIDLGVYGTPETFIVNKAGKIVYRQIGIIDQKTWDEVLFPIVKKYRES